MISKRFALCLLIALAIPAIRAQDEDEEEDLQIPDEFLCEAPVDIMLVWDGSGSVSASEFEQLREFALNISRSYLISPDAAHMGLVQFEYHGLLEFPLLDDQEEVVRTLQTFQQVGGWTNIADGVALAQEQLAEYGRANRAKIMMVLTDGAWNYGGDPQPASNITKDEDTIVLGIGIDLNNRATLSMQAIVTQPYEEFFVEVTDFDELISTVTDLLGDSCIPCPLTCCGHGYCNPSGIPPCVCDTGYTGEDCCDIAPDWLVPLATATTAIVGLVAAAVVIATARRDGLGALPIPLEEIEVEEVEAVAEEVMPLVATPDLDIGTDMAGIVAPPTGPVKPAMYPASRVAPTMNIATTKNYINTTGAWQYDGTRWIPPARDNDGNVIKGDAARRASISPIAAANNKGLAQKLRQSLRLGGGGFGGYRGTMATQQSLATRGAFNKKKNNPAFDDSGFEDDGLSIPTMDKNDSDDDDYDSGPKMNPADAADSKPGVISGPVSSKDDAAGKRFGSSAPKKTNPTKTAGGIGLDALGRVNIAAVGPSTPPPPSNFATRGSVGRKGAGSVGRKATGSVGRKGAGSVGRKATGSVGRKGGPGGIGGSGRSSGSKGSKGSKGSRGSSGAKKPRKGSNPASRGGLKRNNSRGGGRGGGRGGRGRGRGGSNRGPKRM